VRAASSGWRGSSAMRDRGAYGRMAARR